MSEGLSKLGLETLEAAYESWTSLGVVHAHALAELNLKRRQLKDQGEFLLGTVRAAQAQPADGLVKAGSLDAFMTDARRKLDEAQLALESQATELDADFRKRFEAVKKQVRAHIERTSAKVAPKVRLLVRVLANGARIVHLARPSLDESVLLAFAFTGKIPSRHGFLFDDSTDDVNGAGPTLYNDEGVEAVRPSVTQLRALLEAPSEVLPLKGILLARVADQLVRFVERGPVAEAEIEDGEGFRNLLMQAEAERIGGFFLSLKLKGRIELEVAAD